MENWQEEIIFNKMLTKLVSKTQCSDLFLAEFRMTNIISEEEHNRLIKLPHQAYLSATAQNSAFYDIIKGRVGAFKQLYVSLQGTRQSGLANELLEFTRKLNPAEYKNLVKASNGNERVEVGQVAATSLSSNSDGNGPSSFVAQLATAVDTDIKGGNPYKFSATGKRFILPINIVDFNNVKDNRKNSAIDMKNIKDLFPKLGYEVYPEDIDKTLRYSKKDILDRIDDFKNVCRLFKAESCILFIGSHGKEDKIFSSDYGFLRINKHIVQEFYHEKFPCMQGKPKIIIIQACRNFEDNDTFSKLSDNEEDSSTEAEGRDENDQLKEGAIRDTVIIHSQVPGLPSSRNNSVGSWLVHYIKEVFEAKAKSTSVMDMLKEVRDKVNDHNLNPYGQIPEIRDLGYKDFKLIA